MATVIRVKHGGESVDCTPETWEAHLAELVQKHGAWGAGSSVETFDECDTARGDDGNGRALAVRADCPTPRDVMRDDDGGNGGNGGAGYSRGFGAGQQVMDDEARERIERTHDKLRAAGVNVDASEQLFATGTRMMAEGYDTQHARAREHAEKLSARDAADAIIAQVEAEKREEVTTTAGELGESLRMNGKLTAGGFQLREQAIRGLLARIGSPAARFIFGVRDRLASDEATPKQKADDKAAILGVLQSECERFGDVPVQLRLRHGLRDVFAVVSPGYTPADAPAVLPELLTELPADARATWAYDPTSTAWELRASVFTPTPVERQAVGEPFEGYVSIQSRDNGTKRLTGGGGMLLLRCLNASTYAAELAGVSRVHRANITTDLGTLLRAASKAVSIMVDGWGEARRDIIARPRDAQDALIPLEDVVPGFFRAMLTRRRGELVGVLPGRTEHHVARLAATFETERRNRDSINRADLANGWTRYVQAMPTDVRRDAETAAGAWVVSREPVQWAAA